MYVHEAPDILVKFAIFHDLLMLHTVHTYVHSRKVEEDGFAGTYRYSFSLQKDEECTKVLVIYCISRQAMFWALNVDSFLKLY